MKYSRQVVLPLLLLVCLVRCNGCFRANPETPLHLVAPNAPALLWTVNAVELSSGVEQFVGGATRRAGGPIVKRLRKGTAQQIGFDPLRLEELQVHGALPHKGVVVFTEGVSPAPIMAIGISDTKKFDVFLGTSLGKYSSATRLEQSSEQGLVFNEIGRPFGDATVPVIAWTHVRGFALLSEATGLASLKEAALRIQKQDYSVPGSSIVSDPDFIELNSRLDSGMFHFFVRGGDVATRVLKNPLATDSKGLILSGGVGVDGLFMDSFVDLALPGLKEAFGIEPVMPLSAKIEADAVLAFLTRLASEEGLKTARHNKGLGLVIESTLAKMGSVTALDIEKEVIPFFSGPMTFGVHLKEVTELPGHLRKSRGGLMGSLDAMLDVFQVAISAELSDVEGMNQLLETSKKNLEKRGTSIRHSIETIEGKEVSIYENDVEVPRFGWAVVDNLYVYGAGPGRLRQTLNHLLSGEKGPHLDLGKSGGGVLASAPSTSVLVLRTGAAADALLDLVKGAEGKAPSFGMALMVRQLAEVVRSIGDVSVAVRGEDDGMRLMFREKLQ